MTADDGYTHPDWLPKKRRRIFPWVFLGIQVLFLAWIVIGQARTAAPATDCGATGQELCGAAGQIGYTLGRGVAMVFQVFMWVVADIILGIGYLIVRKP